MIIIARPDEATIIPDGWDYPIEELDYLLTDSTSDGVFVLQDGRLHEAVINL
jgi:hypothetical protein